MVYLNQVIIMKSLYDEYGGYFYVPMTQAFSLAVPVTVGCSWDKCSYCDLNHNNSFRILSLPEIQANLEKLKSRSELQGRIVRKVVLAGGNPFCLDTRTLAGVIRLIRTFFPEVTNISSFARADDILRKSPAELSELKGLGMGELSIGIESGNDEILAFHNKGVTVADNDQALARLEELGISYSTYIMLGLGGKNWSRENAVDTGRFLSAHDPEVITVVSLVLFKDAPLLEKVKKREFIRLKPLEYVQEEKLLLENLYMRNTIFNGTHKTNSVVLKGRLPQQKALLLEKLAGFLRDNDPGDIKNQERNKWRRWSVE